MEQALWTPLEKRELQAGAAWKVAQVFQEQVRQRPSGHSDLKTSVEFLSQEEFVEEGQGAELAS